MPAAFRWFRLYCAVLALFYLSVAGLGIFFLVSPPPEMELDRVASSLIGVLFILTGLLLGFATALGPFLPQRDWAWLYGLTLICLGLTSVVLLPLSLPLLILWRKEPVKSWFGRIGS